MDYESVYQRRVPSEEKLARMRKIEAKYTVPENALTLAHLFKQFSREGSGAPQENRSKPVGVQGTGFPEKRVDLQSVQLKKESQPSASDSRAKTRQQTSEDEIEFVPESAIDLPPSAQVMALQLQLQQKDNELRALHLANEALEKLHKEVIDSLRKEQDSQAENLKKRAELEEENANLQTELADLKKTLDLKNKLLDQASAKEEELKRIQVEGTSHQNFRAQVVELYDLPHAKK
jgi:hypothetical protein